VLGFGDVVLDVVLDVMVDVVFDVMLDVGDVASTSWRHGRVDDVVRRRSIQGRSQSGVVVRAGWSREAAAGFVGSTCRGDRTDRMEGWWSASSDREEAAALGF
jgi:hypothetical protein